MIRRPSTFVRLVAIALVGAAVASGCSAIGTGGGTYDVVAYFPRAVSLYKSGSVQVLGLPAGEVTDIEVIGDQVKVTMAISDDIPVPTGVKAGIVPQSLIGERRIQLSPPYQEGDTAIADGYEIAEIDTVVPTEPDEALAAVKEFLDSLDANGIGRLIDNGATALDGQGENLGAAIDELSELVGNIEANDDDLISIAERFDDFTTTLLTRETQLAKALDDFATVADVLAQERGSIEALVQSLADLSGDGLDIVAEHAVRLRTDVAILTRLAQSIDANLDGVQDLVDGGTALTEGFINAYNPNLRAFNLRTSFSPLVTSVLSPLLGAVGIDLPCLPIDVACPAGGLLGLGSGDEAVDVELAASTPIDGILTTFGTATDAGAADDIVSSSTAKDGNLLDAFLGTFLGVGS